MAYEWMEPARPSRRREVEGTARSSAAEATEAAARAAGALLQQQAAEGFWCGELTADTTLESDYILLQLWLHQPDGADCRKAAIETRRRKHRSVAKSSSSHYESAC